MTSDLVEELRNLVGPEVNQEITPFIAVEYSTIKKAADRIEELETELREAEGTIWSLIETINSLNAAPRQKKAQRATMQKERR